MKKIFGIIVLAAIVLAPVSSYAATYAYVTKAGTLATVVADSSTSAFKTAVNIDAKSGVILLSDNHPLRSVIAPLVISYSYATTTVVQ